MHRTHSLKTQYVLLWLLPFLPEKTVANSVHRNTCLYAYYIVMVSFLHARAFSSEIRCKYHSLMEHS